MTKLVIQDGYVLKNIKTGVVNEFGSIFTNAPEDYKELRVIDIEEEKFYVDDSLPEINKLNDVIRLKYSLEEELNLIHEGGEPYKAFKAWRKIVKKAI